MRPHLPKFKLFTAQLHMRPHLPRFYHNDILLYCKPKNKKPNGCQLLFYCTSYRLNMFRTSLCPSSGPRDYDVDYHIGLTVFGLLYVGGKAQLEWSGVRAAGSSTTCTA